MIEPTPLRLLPRNRAWRASWIWPAGLNPETDNAVALFRTSVAVPADAVDAEVLISASRQYRLWIDGELMGDGPPPSAAHHTYFDRYPLPVAARGKRCQLAVLVWTAGAEGANRGGLLCEVVAGDGTFLAASDEHWRARPGDAWRRDTYRFPMNPILCYQEHCDGRLLPGDWMTADPEENDWPPAEVARSRGRRVAPVTGPWSNLALRDIAPLERQTFLPAEIVARETCLRIINRLHAEDAAIEAAQPGSDQAVDELIHDSDGLLSGADDCILRCSEVQPTDPAWDGVRDPALTLRFAEELTAFIEIECTAPAGAVLFIGSAERLIDGRFDHTIEGRFTERYVCREGRQVFRSLHWRAFRYLRLRMADASGPVRIHALRAIRVRTPFPSEGAFAAPDGWQAIDTLCRRTQRLCCVDGIFDTPWRESAQWLGDIAMASLPALHWCYGDTRLSGKFIVQSAQNGGAEGILSNLSNLQPSVDVNTIPDFSLWWLYGLREHYWYTGDADWYRTFYPDAQRILRWHLRHLDEEGFLSDVPYWVFLDWADLTKTGASSTYNAMFAMACDVVAEIADLVGDGDTGAWSRACAERIRASFGDRFWDDERQVVVDAVMEGEQTRKISEHGNALAICFGCLDDALADDLITRAWERDERDDWVECQPFMTRMVLEALSVRGRTDLALRLIEARWGQRFRDRGHETCLEEWTSNGSWRSGTWSPIMRTTSHAWSAAASEFFARRLPGITCLQPGGTRVRVQPHAADFPYRVRVPVGGGWITVDHRPGAVAQVEAEGVTVERG